MSKSSFTDPIAWPSAPRGPSSTCSLWPNGFIIVISVNLVIYVISVNLVQIYLTT